MKRLTSHGKLLGLLWLVLGFSTSLTVLAGRGGLLSDPQPRSARSLTYDQAVDAFGRIVPGMTNAQDLPSLGFDPRTANVAVLSHPDIKTRFMRRAGMRWAQLDPAVRACIRAGIYCTGYVFHPGLGGLAPDLQRVARIASSTPAEVTLLVMNGRVVHKVIS